MSGQVMGDPHPSRIASCMYCFRQAVQKMHRHSWSVVILSKDCSHRQSLQVTRGARGRSPGVGFSAVMVRQCSLSTESISLSSAFFTLLNPWPESSVPPAAWSRRRRASQQRPARARTPGRRSCFILSLFLRTLRLTALHSAGF